MGILIILIFLFQLIQSCSSEIQERYESAIKGLTKEEDLKRDKNNVILTINRFRGKDTNMSL
jgi:hypothetical protein